MDDTQETNHRSIHRILKGNGSCVQREAPMGAHDRSFEARVALMSQKKKVL